MTNARGLLPKARREDLTDDLRPRLERWYRDLRRRQPLLDAGAAARAVRGDHGLRALRVRRRLECRARAVRARPRAPRAEEPLRPLKPRTLGLGRAPGRDGRPGGEARRLRALGPSSEGEGGAASRRPADRPAAADRRRGPRPAGTGAPARGTAPVSGE